MRTDHLACIYIILAFNQPELVEKSVRSFKKYLPKNHKVLVFDNGSKPSLKTLVSRLGVEYFRSSRNLGFAEGANQSLRKVLATQSCEYCAVVNSDVFLHKHFSSEIRAIWPQMLSMNVAAWQPALYKDPELTIVENRGIVYGSTGIAVQNRGEIQKDPLLNGAFLFLRTETVKKLFSQDGFVFTPDFYFNAEDLELSLRLKSRGEEIAVIDKVRAQHLGSQSSSDVSDWSLSLYIRNLLWVVLIAWSRTTILLSLPFLLFGQLRLLVQTVLRGKPQLYASAWLDTIKHQKRLQSLRRSFQEKAKR